MFNILFFVFVQVVSELKHDEFAVKGVAKVDISDV